MPDDLKQIIERISLDVRGAGTTRESLRDAVLRFANTYGRANSDEEREMIDKEVFDFLKNFIDFKDITALEYFRVIYDREKRELPEFYI